MAKLMHVSGKVSDMFNFTLVDTSTDKYIVPEYDGYVPTDAGVGGGDYIHFTVDVETGQIIGWKNPLLSEDFKEEVGIKDDESE